MLSRGFLLERELDFGWPGWSLVQVKFGAEVLAVYVASDLARVPLRFRTPAWF